MLNLIKCPSCGRKHRGYYLSPGAASAICEACYDQRIKPRGSSTRSKTTGPPRAETPAPAGASKGSKSKKRRSE